MCTHWMCIWFHEQILCFVTLLFEVFAIFKFHSYSIWMQWHSMHKIYWPNLNSVITYIPHIDIRFTFKPFNVPQLSENCSCAYIKKNIGTSLYLSFEGGHHVQYSYPVLVQRRGQGRRLPPTPCKPSTLHLKPSNINFPKLNASPTHVCILYSNLTKIIMFSENIELFPRQFIKSI